MSNRTLIQECGLFGPVYGWDRTTSTPGTDGYRNVWVGNMWSNGAPLRL